MKLIDLIKKVINPLKIDIVKYPNSDLRRRKKLLAYHKVSKIIDVGANIGQYAMLTRKLGFKGEIISFEPGLSEFNKLLKNSEKDKNWKIYNLALGSREEKSTINISKNSYSSSMLEVLTSLTSCSPDSEFIKKESINVTTLDSLYSDLVDKNDVVLLKIDVQGAEKQVIHGAKESLKKIKGIQIEMSLEELYKEETLFLEMIEILKNLGFNLYSIENGFFNSSTGKLLQIDGIFFRDE
jgi:FkbM family methyltransferase